MKKGKIIKLKNKEVTYGEDGIPIIDEEKLKEYINKKTGVSIYVIEKVLNAELDYMAINDIV